LEPGEVEVEDGLELALDRVLSPGLSRGPERWEGLQTSFQINCLTGLIYLFLMYITYIFICSTGL
jgi:hypothetical protein